VGCFADGWTGLHPCMHLPAAVLGLAAAVGCRTKTAAAGRGNSNRYLIANRLAISN